MHSYQSLDEPKFELEHLIEIMPVPMVIYRGPNHVYARSNAAHDQLVGKKVQGRPVAEAFGADELQDIISILNQVYKTGEKYETEERLFEISLTGGKQKKIWVNLGFYPFHNTKGQVDGILGVAQDVTKMKLTEIQLNSVLSETLRQKEELESERELRERFVATLSHDLRTPLTAAKMSAQMLIRKAHNADVLSKAPFRIAENIDRADMMIQNLLDANRMKVGEKIPIECTECQIQSIIEDTIEELASIHGDRFIVKYEKPIEGCWSINGVRRVIENLCSNAIKYGDQNRPITISVHQIEENVEICVHNYGPAIPQADQKTIFEPFRRARIAQLGGQKGWGLGLTLVRGITESHGGTVQLESDAEKGTTFRVTLPRDPRQSEKSGGPCRT